MESICEEKEFCFLVSHLYFQSIYMFFLFHRVNGIIPFGNAPTPQGPHSFPIELELLPPQRLPRQYEHHDHQVHRDPEPGQGEDDGRGLLALVGVGADDDGGVGRVGPLLGALEAARAGNAARHRIDT